MSAAFVALTTQDEPTTPGVNVEPEMVHVPDTTAYDTAPVPDPPLVASERVVPYVTVVVETVNGACEPLATVAVAGEVAEVLPIPFVFVTTTRNCFPPSVAPTS